ncbi:UDP-N-acetylglucosamine--N-acetylmuramyl-(pentapeptide) pyrophosphoryl-undecaprenol N-acetylglucosamine transferase [Ananas comosus]|uniref:UDP-N-acetylglucosamine--N-acetylmuramyl-(Pentapeptide) pyrophosphoryl-undecaprenol N-acetylglucosamine transferase n=1 Tax=Ananas comosus TaxID=4615 RepID=A0A199UVR3_ANACO|nr:UDP-N-acetylglucosamine--N-acetylmuramyl-(pentapeptide) pyrophosphoryl-undecaprenol N-acetylglucosamine transferase [Ananas comosus]
MATLTSSYLSSPFSPLLLSPSSSPTTTTTTTTIIISFTNATTFSTRNARQVPLPLLHNRPPPQRFLCCLAVDHGGAEASSPHPAAPPPAELRVALAGGGTGGHIYPAIAIADDLRSAAAAADAAPRFLFLGSASGIEASAVPAAGYEFAPVPPSRLARPLLLRPSNLLLPLRLLRSVAACLRVLRDFRPDVVVGTGGYVAFPVCLAALILNITIVIQEQNSFPGLTNRLLAPFAAKIFLAFNACVKHFPKKKCFVYGNPVRLALRRFTSKVVARSHFFPKAGADGKAAEVVLVLGGSIGSAAINIAMLNMYYEMLMEHKNRYIIWQTGAEGYCEMESLVKNNRRLLLAPFLNAMDMAYAAADVVVSRAGAMTCTEILATGKPSILIPSPTATDDHQTKNAYIMAEVAGSKVLTEDELDSSSLATAIDEILGDKNLMAEMSEKALSVARPNASVEIARCILSLVNKPTPK